ncbi:MAG: rhodanese-like domain-containing protein [Planctomycetota bacterium]
MRFTVAFVLAVLVGLSTCHRAKAQLGSLLGGSIETIDTNSLRRMLDDRNQVIEQAKRNGKEPPSADFVVVDVRSSDEVGVSIIPGAITKTAFEKNQARYREVTVIPYCLSGGRSTAYARKLVRENFEVLNYKVSILGWVNSELPLTTLEGVSTKRVHVATDRYSVPAGYERVK